MIERSFAINILTKQLEDKDPYTRAHCTRVAFYSRMIGEYIGLSTDELSTIVTGALLHDIGKICIPDEVLKKPSKLTDDEFALIKKHPQLGVAIVEEYESLNDILPVVLYHHEKFNGGGYPSKLIGESIPLFARIVCVADAFDAMTSYRVYCEAIDATQAMTELQHFSGTQFDPFLVEVFNKALYRVGTAIIESALMH